MDRRWSVWAAYTQQNQWQLYNDEISRPFRETNYEPELMLAHNPEVELGGFRWRLMTLSFNHQSNGRADPLSRSWNRLVGGLAIERDGLVLMARAWYRFKESADKDDNPDITDYLGYGDLTALYKWHGHAFKVVGRGNLHKGKGAGEFTWSSPPILGPLRLYAQLFTGYGESMIDYNWNQTTLGVGFALNDLF
jgi:phospholipase A1